MGLRVLLKWRRWMIIGLTARSCLVTRCKHRENRRARLSGAAHALLSASGALLDVFCWVEWKCYSNPRRNTSLGWGGGGEETINEHTYICLFRPSARVPGRSGKSSRAPEPPLPAAAQSVRCAAEAARAPTRSSPEPGSHCHPGIN